MKKARIVCAVLLGALLILFGSNWFLDFLPLPEPDDSPGQQVLKLLRDGRVMTPVSLFHIALGALMLFRQTRFFGALMHLPMTLGICAFHAWMMREGLGFALFLLVLNVVAAWDKGRLCSLLDTKT